MSDLISREDAIKALDKEYRCTDKSDDWEGLETAIKIIDTLLSPEAEPTVIRSRTLMPTKDFKEWAKRIREVNPNAVVIPCDAEVVSEQAEKCEDCIHNGTDKDKITCKDCASAEATCATCADRALCIMSAPDGNWKACKDYRTSAEAVEVVRCGECKYWHSNTEFCDVWSCLNVAQRTLNLDYCSRGERREDGEA